MMIRLSPRTHRLASLVAGTVLLYGCAAHRADDTHATAPSPPPSAPPVVHPPIVVPPSLPPATVPPAVAIPPTRPEGHIAFHPGRVGHVVAAPHATSDLHTGDIASEVARRTGFGLVVASGFVPPDNGHAGGGRRYQVNRPLEGVPGRPAAEQVASEAARRVYELYERRVLEASQGPLRFYAEIHGDSRAPCTAQIEIATVGVDFEVAVRLRALAELIRDAHLRANREVDRLQVLIEPVDTVGDGAAGAKRDGILRWPERALHIELPRCARRDWRDAYTAILADFLAQAVALVVGR
jgi:hypothetical protein